MQMIPQRTFTLGEVDEISWKRTDIEGYLTGAQSLLNQVVGTTGLTKKRDGTLSMLDVTAQANQNSRLYEFKDNLGNYYIIVSGNTTLNIYLFPGTTASLYQIIAGVPYTTSDLPNIDYALDGDSLVLTNGNYPPARCYVSQYTPSVGFNYMVQNIFPYPAYDFGTINYNNFAVVLTAPTPDTIQLQFTGLASDPGFTTAWVGGQIIGAGNAELSPIGSAIITAVVPFTGGTVTFTGTVQTPFNTTTPATLGSQYSIRQPAWSNALGWPKKCLFYQNRQWLANTQSLPDTIFGSRINQPVSFDVGTGLDTDAIVYNIGQSGTGGINWMNGGKQMEIYTENYELVCPQDQNNALTPSTFSIRQQSSYGSSPLMKPLTYINDSYYVTRNGNAIINFHFNGLGLAYTSSNVSVHSEHLVQNPSRAALIRGSDVSQDNFIYFNNKTSQLANFQFAAEYKLAALAPITFTQSPTITILDVCSVNNRLVYLKYYANSGKYMLEVQDNTSISPLKVKMDSTKTATMATSGLVTGIDYLNGYNAHAVSPTGDLGGSMQLVNGVLLPAPVTAGQAYFDNSNDPTYSGNVTVGILFENDVTPMFTFAGANETNFYKNITRIFVDYFQSLDFRINGTQVLFQDFREIAAIGYNLTSRSGTAVISPVNGWNRFNTFTISQVSPYDLIITGISYEVEAAII